MTGLQVGPRLAGWYHATFPPPTYTTGDHAARQRLSTRFGCVDRPQAKAGTPVVLYATSACPYCAKVRKLFAERHVAYTEYRIDTSVDANRDFLARKGLGVPLLYIGERRIDGFREAAIIDALAVLDTTQ